MINLFPHQQKIVDLNPSRHLLAHSTGTGKTLTAISLAQKNCKTCLVIVPKALVAKWKRDYINFMNTNERTNFVMLIVMSKEEFKKEVSTLPPYDGVIVDEAHYFAGEKSQLTKALLWYNKTHDIKYRWLLTATPYLSTPMNIYVLARHLGHNMNWRVFRDTFFYDVRMGHRMVPVAKKGMEKELARIVKSIGSTVDMEEAVELAPELGEIPDQIFETEYFDLTKEQKEGIKNLNDDLFITRWTHTHQIENGFLYGDGYSQNQSFPCKKTERLIKIVSSNKKVAVFCRYTLQIKYLKEVLSKYKENIFVVDGSSSSVERDQIIQDAEKSENSVIIIQAQCSAGYELPSFNTIVFMSMSFSFVDYQQGIGRFLRINSLSKNKYIHLVSKGVDKDVYDSIMKKQDFSIAIYDRS